MHRQQILHKEQQAAESDCLVISRDVMVEVMWPVPASLSACLPVFNRVHDQRRMLGSWPLWLMQVRDALLPDANVSICSCILTCPCIWYTHTCNL
jgi:hypothetical protein